MSIELPQGIPCVADSMFYACTAMKKVTLPTTITTIGVNAFFNCNHLTSIVLPNSVEYIKELAFNLCYGMTTITMPSSLKEIGDRAFDNCNKLKAITIPSAVTSIGNLAFCGCTSLKNINVSEDNLSFCSIDGVLFNKDVTTLICCPAGKIGNYILPMSVTTIGEYGFYYCRLLQSITLPMSLKTIENHGFRLCSELKTIALPPGLDTIENDAFSQCTGLKTILCYSQNVPEIVSTTFSAKNLNVPLYVPEDALSKYQNAAYWKEFSTIQPITSEEVTGILGDANNDGEVNVIDVMRCVTSILFEPPNPFFGQMADINFDGRVSVADVMGIIDIVIGL